MLATAGVFAVCVPVLGINLQQPMLMPVPIWKISNARLRVVAIVALCVNAASLCAQAPTMLPGTAPDSSQIMTVMANSMRLLKPARFALDHRADLALTPVQVSLLEQLVIAQRDSADVRHTRLIALTQTMIAKRPPSGFIAAMQWTGAADEQAIKDSACQQSVVQAEGLINLVRDRHAVGAVLTPAQIAQLPMMEASDMMSGMKKP